MIFPTKWPMLDFHFQIWKFAIVTCICRNSMQSNLYEYLTINFIWNYKTFFQFKLYDTWLRLEERK